MWGFSEVIPAGWDLLLVQVWGILAMVSILSGKENGAVPAELNRYKAYSLVGATKPHLYLHSASS
jgi:hypothetical protein